MTDKNSSMRQLPKVDEMIRCIESEGLTNVPTVLVKHACQKEIELERQKILSGRPFQYSRQDLIRRIKAEIEKQIAETQQTGQKRSRGVSIDRLLSI